MPKLEPRELTSDVQAFACSCNSCVHLTTHRCRDELHAGTTGPEDIVHEWEEGIRAQCDLCQMRQPLLALLGAEYVWDLLIDSEYFINTLIRLLTSKFFSQSSRSNPVSGIFKAVRLVENLMNYPIADFSRKKWDYLQKSERGKFTHLSTAKHIDRISFLRPFDATSPLRNFYCQHALPLNAEGIFHSSRSR